MTGSRDGSVHGVPWLATWSSGLAQWCESGLEEQLGHELLARSARVAAWIFGEPALRVGVLRAVAAVECSVGVDATALVLRHCAADVPPQRGVLVDGDLVRDERRDDRFGAGHHVWQGDRPQHGLLRAAQLANERRRRIQVVSERSQVGGVAGFGLTDPAAARSSPALRSAPPMPMSTICALFTAARVDGSDCSWESNSLLVLPPSARLVTTTLRPDFCRSRRA